ncbi:MAG: glycosyltransferase family 4 protein [Methylococcales bacterium]
MSQNCKLIVVTLMTPQGETGVQTHFNAILDEAAKSGIKTQLITPHISNLTIFRKAAGLIGKILRPLSKEWLTLWFRWVQYSLLIYQLKQLLQNEEDNIVIYAQDPLSSKAALATKKNRHRVVTVVHFNISEADEVLTKGLTVENGRLYRQFQSNEAKILPKVDKIIFVSRFMQTIVNDRLPSLQSVPHTVIANFIQDSSNTRNKPKLQGDLICIGTLEKRKNQAFILRVLAKAHDRGYHYRLTIIGNGPDRSMLEKLTDELGLNDSVTFLGLQANAAEYMTGHRIYVHAALMENLPITLLEALCHGLPILAPAVGGIPEVFSDGQQGYFWPLDDLDAATDKLCEILENNNLHAQFSAQARDRFVENFSENRLAHKWLEELTNA